ncbi:MAG TPA: XVIPCD domain-containing protein [Dyella sp.]|uniref:XVIPCD domain-containing protein n=1 Tax=Dyella sp. TaxID=1869338 RepID=UPI002F93BA53
MDDGAWLTAKDGTVAWRNNNPGNLKFEYAGSSDTTARTQRTKARALARAQADYQGVVDLDQWGNAIFESYEAGRKAQKKLLQNERMNDKTVEQLVKSYSTADYSGNTHHANQVAIIYATADAQGQDLHEKKVVDMSPEELNALADGLAKAEHWKAGSVERTQPLTEEQLRDTLAASSPTKAASAGPSTAMHRQGDRSAAVGQLQQDLTELGFTARDGQSIAVDRHFGPRTREAVEAFQQAHGLRADGIAGPATLAALAEAKSQAAIPELTDVRHPAHGMYAQAFQCVARLDESHGRTPGPHTQMFAGSLTSAALGAGMQRIDHVLLSDDASRGFAVQGALDSPFKQYAEVGVMQAIQTPLCQSSREAADRIQTTAQQDAPQAQAMQEPAMASPVMGR